MMLRGHRDLKVFQLGLSSGHGDFQPHKKLSKRGSLFVNRIKFAARLGALLQTLRKVFESDATQTCSSAN